MFLCLDMRIRELKHKLAQAKRREHLTCMCYVELVNISWCLLFAMRLKEVSRWPRPWVLGYQSN